MNVLVIEDNPQNMKLISCVLKKYGHVVFEALRKIREKMLNIPIIAITSYAMAGDREKVMAAGCVGYFEKPINPLTIMKDIEKVLRGRNP